MTVRPLWCPESHSRRRAPVSVRAPRILPCNPLCRTRISPTPCRARASIRPTGPRDCSARSVSSFPFPVGKSASRNRYARTGRAWIRQAARALPETSARSPWLPPNDVHDVEHIGIRSGINLNLPKVPDDLPQSIDVIVLKRTHPDCHQLLEPNRVREMVR